MRQRRRPAEPLGWRDLSPDMTMRQPRRGVRTVIALVSIAVVAACASTGVGSGGPATPTAGSGVLSGDAEWPTSTREHVDLWLHGYALLTADTARVPFFERGYRSRMRALKTQRNVLTNLDANADQLSSRFLANPSLVNGQFLPLYFSSFEQIQQVVNLYLQSGGDPRAATDASLQQYFAVLSGSFPSGPDRDWLRLFVQSLADESARFYHDYWTAEQRAHTPTRQAVDSVWRVYRPRLRRFLTNTQQENGEFILSLPLDGEGRSTSASKRENAVTVGFPDTPETAIEAVYVFAHEVVNAITNTAIADNTSPAEQRSGATGRYAANATVRAGALLLQRAIPELGPNYMRFYLRAAGLTAPTGDPITAFAAAFPIPDAVRDAIARQLDVVLGGI